MALTADHLIVIGRGKLIADTSVEDFVARASAKVVLVRSPELQRLRELLERPGVTFEGGERGSLEVHGLTTEQVGDAAAAARHRDPRADAAAGLARGGVHEPHPHSGRVRLARADAGGGRRMSTLAPAQVIPRLEHTGRVTQLRVFLSELTKLRSVRSTKWSLLAAFVLTIGVPAIAAAVFSHHWPQMSPHDRADFHPLELTFVGVQIAQLAIGVLGVLVITAEYSTGMIRASMTAVPRRLPVLWGKAVVYALVTLALMTPAVLLAFVVSQGILSGRHINIAFTHAGRPSRGLRRGALPDRDRALRARARRDRAQHGRRDRDLRRDDVRPAPADERAARRAGTPPPRRTSRSRRARRCWRSTAGTSSRPGPASASSARMSRRRW